MEPITLASLQAQAAAFDQAALATPGIDHFCSSSAWVLSAHETLMPPRTPWLFAGEQGYIAMAHGIHEAGFGYLEPLELSWGLASPLLGPDPTALVRELVEQLQTRDDWRYALIPGVPANQQWIMALASALPSSWQLRAGAATNRHVAVLDGDRAGDRQHIVEDFLARRSRNFRRSLQRSVRDAEQRGLRYQRIELASAADVDAAMARIIAIEERSWKGIEGVGLRDGAFREFYRHMLLRLATAGAARLWFGLLGERDVSYILGGVLGSTYRGLQFSYDDTLADLAPGNLGQFHQLVELAREGITAYDLGTEMDYKRRWADEVHTTQLFVIVRA